MILVPDKIKEDLLHALYRKVGLETPGQGIAFAMPVDHVVGLSKDEPQKTEEDEEDGEQQ